MRRRLAGGHHGLERVECGANVLEDVRGQGDPRWGIVPRGDEAGEREDGAWWKLDAVKYGKDKGEEAGKVGKRSWVGEGVVEGR